MASSDFRVVLCSHFDWVFGLISSLISTLSPQLAWTESCGMLAAYVKLLGGTLSEAAALLELDGQIPDVRARIAQIDVSEEARAAFAEAVSQVRA